jgi:1,2-phenylacetyl-CoA epoxidase catalytic subunit
MTSQKEEDIQNSIIEETGATLKEWCDIVIIKYLIGEKNIHKWLISENCLRPPQAEIIIKTLNIKIKKKTYI